MLADIYQHTTTKKLDMIYRILLQLALCRAALSLSLPFQQFQRQLIRSAAASAVIVATTSLPISSAHAADEVIQINVDVPALIQIAKDNQDLALKLAQQTAGAVKITNYPKSYSNLFNFARDVAAGDVFVQINGFPIDVSLLSEKGAIDVDVSTEVGDVSVTFSSDFLPKLPFLSKRTISSNGAVLDTTSGSRSNDNNDDAASTKTSVRTRAAAAIQSTKDVPNVSILDQPFFLDPFQQKWTNQQVLGTTSLGLGVAYASSYAYYIKSIEEEEMAAAAKKKNAAANNKAKVVTTPVKVTPPVAPVAVTVESPVDVVQETNDLQSDAVNAVVKPTTKSTATTTDRNTEPVQKSGRWFRFWNREN